MGNKIFGLVDQYINNLLVEQDEVLTATEASIFEANIPAISISANQGKFLHVLARLVNAKKILEVGTLGGYSTIWLARALPEDGIMLTLELSEHHAAVAQKN